MEIFYSTIVFMYGLLLGSFYNVVGYRVPNNLSIIRPGSFCPKCKHELKWYELIPVLSFLIQKGKCRKCGSKISLFYPFIELTTGILFLISYLVFGFSFEFIMSLLAISFFVIVVVCDISYLIIPDEITAFFCLVSIGLQLSLKGYELALSSAFFGCILFFLMYFIMLIGSKIMNEEALGGGDVKLMFFVGTILNTISPIKILGLTSYFSLINGFCELFLASCLASPFAFYNFFSKKGRMIPFGPFILLALIILRLYSFDFVEFFVK